MGLLGGVEGGVDAEVEADRAGLEPAAAAGREHRRLGGLGHAEDIDVVRAQRVLRSGRRRELYVIDGHQHGQAPFTATANRRRKGRTVP
ncbi:hypothetical protein K376_05656 [Streptomyces sp. PsTaAH-130]|nr:hypothetical protein K376_05656 [Streptomyces sp. PsTaAH-130]